METLPSGITQQMIDDAKKKYGENRVVLADLFKAEERIIPDLSILVAKPDSRVRNEFIKWMEKNPKKAEEILINSCVLSHKEQVLADEDLIVAAVDAISQLMPTGKAVIKKV